MKDNDNHKLSDDELDTFLAGKDEVNRAYRELDKTTSPRHLDEKILSRARESVAREPDARRDVFVRPYAVAATVFLCLTITFLFVNDPDVPTPADLRSPDEALRRTVPVTLEPAQEQQQAAAPISVETDTGTTDADDQPLRAQARVESVAAERVRADDEAGAVSVRATLLDESREELTNVPDTQFLEEITAGLAEPEITNAASQDSLEAITVTGSRLLNTADYRADQETWLREIARLRAAGETERAGQEVALFLESYPDADIEAELADLEQP